MGWLAKRWVFLLVVGVLAPVAAACLEGWLAWEFYGLMNAMEPEEPRPLHAVIALMACVFATAFAGLFARLVCVGIPSVVSEWLGSVAIMAEERYPAVSPEPGDLTPANEQE